MARSGKVTVVGAGFYGSTTAMRLAEYDIFDEVVLVSVFVLTVEDGQVAAIRVVRNPDKLGALARQLG